MATMSVLPIEIVNAPNFFSYLPDRQWVFTHGSAVTLAGQVCISDALGNRRYMLPGTASLQLTFLRADTQAPTPGPFNQGQVVAQGQSVVKTAVVSASDRSQFTFQLTQADTQTIISGSVIFTLSDTAPGNIQANWVQNYAVKKLLVGPGF